ncbi:hypothetical protein [Streptosporangium longisporum]|uniref:ABC transporter permease n=1 Tax=Streptosporangium longisporum TaxID=46187 RepID=A0ABP6L1X7_9ACTN
MPDASAARSQVLRELRRTLVAKMVMHGLVIIVAIAVLVWIWSAA